MTDPIFAAIAAVDLARGTHLAALDDLDESSAAQMGRANAAADAERTAFQQIAEVMPTTLRGLHALVERYAAEAERDECLPSGGLYMRHVAKAVLACESKGCFSACCEQKSPTDERLGRANRNAPWERPKRIPDIVDIVAGWRSLTPQMRERIGVMVVDMVLQGFISGEAYIASGQPEDLAVLDEEIRGNAKCAEDELLTTLTQVVEAALPDLFGAPDCNPLWCDNPGARP
ncbi:hypothetical protein MMB17_18400 [Methylobacterium organophilum]|uniref:hypothetical protein n=1 Tax=Methylobacterium organophilum TaxID=410 RepID=UPI001F13B516|nr:hypothetical protein [Methylobacterium organophilum]UMY16635.1 hypothetical protein MMB17_18400 [Methylobacterium organophilum]